MQRYLSITANVEGEDMGRRQAASSRPSPRRQAAAWCACQRSRPGYADDEMFESLRSAWPWPLW